ncbi:MAG: T9SS type A sorting domain-containing protein [Cryomorphaceae bacterium]
MKKIYFLLFAAMLMTFQSAVAQSDLVITGVVDGDLTGGKPTAIEIYVINDIADLSIYGIGSANNGGGTDGVEFVFPADGATAGDFIYINSDDTGDDALFNGYFGFDADYQSSAAAINGDDAVELFLNDVVVDVFGDINVNGDDQSWDYTDGWAYRQNGTGPSDTFTESEWPTQGAGLLDGVMTNAEAEFPFPLGTYSPEGGGGDPVEATIQEIQESVDGDSPLIDQIVITSGIVTAAYDEGFWIQDGTGAWSGVFVREDNPATAVGDAVSITGIVQENFGLTRVNNLTDLTVETSGNALPAAEVLTTAAAGTEEWEGVLIQVLEVTCTDNDLGFGEWSINDGSGDYRVDDELYNAAPQLLVGYDLTGVAHFSFGDFKLFPRDAADVVLNTNANELGLAFEASAIGEAETAGTITIEVEIINPADVETTVEVAVTGGTAVNGTNYNFTDPTVLTFAASDATAQTFQVEIIDDLDANEDRTVIFTLQNATNGAVFPTGELTLTIQDDDTAIELTDIAVAAEEDANGVAINIGDEFTVAGLVYGVNMNGSGQSFTIIDQTGGVGTFSNTVVSDYMVTEGDSIVLTGTISQFNGLTQFNPSQIDLISQGNEINEPTVVTELTNDIVSTLVKIECVFLTDPGQWTGSGSGFNVTVSDGPNEYTVRIDNDVDLYSASAPAGTFDVTGIVGQFDSEAPLLEGIQLLPRTAADIVSQDCGIVTPPVNDDCAAAIAIDDLLGGPIGEAQFSSQYSNDGATVEENDVTSGFDCFGEPDGTGSAPSLENTVWFEFVGDGNTYFLETNECNGTAEEYIPDGDTQIAVYIGFCGIFQAAFLCNEDGPNATDGNFAAGIEIPTVAGQDYTVMVDGYLGVAGDFCLSMTRLPSANDECDGAIDISDLTGGALDEPQTSGAFSNVGATSENDPNPNDAGDICWFDDPATTSTVWFSFVGDGQEYVIQTTDCAEATNYISDGDTQMAIFTGDCGDLTQIACNEDLNSDGFEAGITLVTEVGVAYQVMVDGFDGEEGDFCMQMTMTSALSSNNADAFEFSAYPNPTNGMVTVESPVSLENVALINVLGQRVKEWNITSAERFEFNTNDVEPGVYLLQAMSEGKVSTLKLIVE